MNKPEEAKNLVQDYLSALKGAGVGPKHFAEFVKNMAGSDNGGVGSDASQDNLPGWAYLTRVAEASFNALQAHGKAANNAWEEIRRGRYGFGTAMQTFARLAENYYGVICEATRGLEAQRRPAWLLVQYSRKNPPVATQSIRLETVLAPQELEFSQFEIFGEGKGQSNLFTEKGKPRADGARIWLTLDSKRLADTKAVKKGHYVSFIFPKGAGSGPPVAIVVLHVKD